MTRITIKHPTINRRKTFTRSQRDDALRHLAVGWNIVDPDEQDLDTAFDLADLRAGSEVAVHDPTSGDSVAVTLVDPPEGNVGAVLDWVGDDPDRAESALAAELSSPHPRSTLIAQLETIPNQEEE